MIRQRPAVRTRPPLSGTARTYAICAIVFAVAAALTAPTACADMWLYLAVGAASLAVAVWRGRGAPRSVA